MHRLDLGDDPFTLERRVRMRLPLLLQCGVSQLRRLDTGPCLGANRSDPTSDPVT